MLPASAPSSFPTSPGSCSPAGDRPRRLGPHLIVRPALGATLMAGGVGPATRHPHERSARVASVAGSPALDRSARDRRGCQVMATWLITGCSTGLGRALAAA